MDLFVQGAPGGETVEYLPYVPDGQDDYGDPAPGYGEPIPYGDVIVDAPKSNEPRDGSSERLVVDLILFMPPGFTCGSRDRFKVRGDEYQVEGLGTPNANVFTGAVFRTEVAVRRVTG